MLIKNKDDVVSFSFVPEDAQSLVRLADLSTRVQPALLELIQREQREAAARFAAGATGAHPRTRTEASTSGGAASAPGHPGSRTAG